MGKTIEELRDDETVTTTGAELKAWKAQLETRAAQTAAQRGNNELPAEMRDMLGVQGGAKDPYARMNLTTQQRKGLAFGRFLRAMALAGSDDPSRIEGALKQLQSENNPLDEIVKRTLNESTLASGGLFIRPEYSDVFTEALQAKSVVRQAGANVVSMAQGNLTFQKEDTYISETWHGENTAIAVSEPTFSEVTMSTKRIGVLIPISQALVAHGGAGIEVRIQNSAINRIAAAQDAKFLRGDGTAYTPKGLKNWISSASTNTFNAAGVTLANMRADLIKMWRGVLDANVDPATARMAFVTSPLAWQLYAAITDGNGNAPFEAQLAMDKLQGAAFYKTTNIPANLGSGAQTEVMLADFNEFFIGEDAGLTVEYVRNATFLDGDGNQVNGLQKNIDAIKITQGVDSLFLRSTAGVLMEAFG